MSPLLVTVIIVLYFAALLIISHLTSRKADTETFFTAHRKSPWYLVAFGMIGASLSGVTFISVPGNVGKIGFAYFQVVLGYLVGYWVIIGILLPLYYRTGVVSIYTYLEQRFDQWAYRTGSMFFLVSRTIGSSLRLFLAATVLQIFLFDAWQIPFALTVVITLLLIWVYTYRGGIKTIVWTDTFQTFFLVTAVVISVWEIARQMNFSFGDVMAAIHTQGYSQIFHFDDPDSRWFFPKAFIGGACIAITMTGMDQEIMQKNLTCRSLRDAQKNMFWFSLILVGINYLFLMLGALLYLFCTAHSLALPSASDELYPLLALHHLGVVAGIFFLLGITASSFASADSALAGLTTSFCIDFLHFKNKAEVVKQTQKTWVHIGFSFLFFIFIILFKELNQRSVIDAVLELAGYTYGPLLGLFTFGLFTRKQVAGIWIPVVCVCSVVVSYLVAHFTPLWFDGYQFGFDILLVNGIFTFLGLLGISKSSMK